MAENESPAAVSSGRGGAQAEGRGKPRPDHRTRKRTVTLPASQIAEVEEFAGKGGFSAATAQALSQWVALQKAKAWVSEYEAEAGEISQAERDAMVAEWGGV